MESVSFRLSEPDEFEDDDQDLFGPQKPLDTDSEVSFRDWPKPAGSEFPPTMRLEDVHEVQVDGSVPLKESVTSTRSQNTSNNSLPQKKSDYGLKPQDPLDYLMTGSVKEWEKKSSTVAMVWHKMDYAMAKNGFIYRTKTNSGRELAPFDLRTMDIDRMPRNSDPHFPATSGQIQSIRLLKYGYDGAEMIWYFKCDDVETMTDWYNEIKNWKDEWYRQDWRQNLYVQTEKVPLHPETDHFDLAASVASERDIHLSNNRNNKPNAFVSSLDLLR